MGRHLEGFYVVQIKKTRPEGRVIRTLHFLLLNFGSSRKSDEADQRSAEEPECGWYRYYCGGAVFRPVAVVFRPSFQVYGHSTARCVLKVKKIGRLFDRKILEAG